MEQTQAFLVATGIDTLKINVKQCDAEGQPVKEQALSGELAAACRSWQEQAQAAGKPARTSITFHDARIVMYPNGAPAWKYILRNDCLELKIGPRLRLPMMAKVTFLSEYLWKVGNVKDAIEEVESLLSDLFGPDLLLQAAQIDMCVDLVGWRPPKKWERVFITKAIRKKAIGASGEKNQEYYQGHKLETLLFSGHGRPVNGKIYNKLAEIKQTPKGKVWFFDRWKEAGWNGDDDVWRVELSVERDGFHEMEVESVTEANENVKRLWAYMTNDWLRMVKPSSDTNQSRWATHPVWKLVQRAFDTYGSQDLDGLGPLVRGRKRQKAVEQITAQIAGCITTLAAWEEDIDVHSQTLEDEILELAHKKVRERWKKTRTVTQDIVRDKKFIYSQVP